MEPDRLESSGPEKDETPVRPGRFTSAPARRTRPSRTPRGQTPDGGATPPTPRKPWRNPLVILPLAVVMLFMIAPTFGPAPEKISLTEAVRALNAGEISKIRIDDSSRQVELVYAPADDVSTDGSGSPSSTENTDSTVVLDVNSEVAEPYVIANFPVGYGPDLVEIAESNGVEVTALSPSRPNIFVSFLLSMVPLLLVIVLIGYLMRRGSAGMMGSFSKMPKSRTDAKVPDTRFSDVAGMQEVVDELKEVVGYLHEPDRFSRLGGKVPHGFMLVGPPGTGKTMLARAVAGEAGVPFFALSGSDFVETFVGVGASRVRSIFQQAREAKRAIIFIDELDAVGRARGGGPFSGANEESERTLNALLVEMDGFQRNDSVIVLAATNRPEVLDQALLRPGRFDRHILVALPDKDARAKILAIHARDKALDVSVDFAQFSKRCVGLSGADLEFIVNEATLQAGRENAERITMAHFDHAIAVSQLGRERRSSSRSERSRRLTAWHEAGHTVAALMQDDVEDPVSVSIVPRGLTGGATWLSGVDEEFVSRRFALAQLAMTLAGRAGEERLVGDDYTSGATGDLQQATALASKMVFEWGMGSRNLMFRPTESKLAEDEVQLLLEESLAKARQILEQNSVLHVAVAEALLEEETLDLARLVALRSEFLETSPTAQGS
jgi:cell division protease FtsH